MKNRLFYCTHYLLSLLLVCCASQGQLGGGPIDSEGPKIISIKPGIDGGKLIGKEKIVLHFDELLNPKSITNSITTYPEMKINTRIKDNKIIIESINKWPLNTSIEITVDRSLSDYHGNNIDETIQLSFNANSAKYNYTISGVLVDNYNEDIFQIALYNWPLSLKNKTSPYKVVQSNSNKGYQFNYIKPGKYIIFATADNVINPLFNIRNNFYGLSNQDYIEIIKSNHLEDIYIDLPLKRHKIEEIECINNNYFKINISNGDVVDFIPDDNYKPSDTISISLNMQNQLEDYLINIEQYIIPDKIDTIPPRVLTSYSMKDSLFIEFSEPLKIKDSLQIYGLSTELDLLEYVINSSKKIGLKIDDIKQVEIIGSSIIDYSNNTMLDSIKTIICESNKIEQTELYLSSITGMINIKNDNRVVIQAINIDTEKVYTTVDNLGKFYFNSVTPGNYIFWAYYMENEVDSLRYFSGTLDPYKPSSQFTFLQDTIEVRKNWDIEGLLIDFY